MAIDLTNVVVVNDCNICEELCNRVTNCHSVPCCTPELINLCGRLTYSWNALGPYVIDPIELTQLDNGYIVSDEILLTDANLYKGGSCTLPINQPSNTNWELATFQVIFHCTTVPVTEFITHPNSPYPLITPGAPGGVTGASCDPVYASRTATFLGFTYLVEVYEC